MTKAELITKTIDRITDPWDDCPEDYIYLDPINLETAEEIICQCREEDVDFDQGDRLPEEVTPEIMMEAYNCNLRKNLFEYRVEQLAWYITQNEMVCEYDNYYKEFSEKKLDVYPVDFIWESFPFKTTGDMSPDNPYWLIQLGWSSRNTFCPKDEYCWYDRENDILHSTNTPFADGILDAKAFARFILLDRECLEYIVDDMSDEDICNIFARTKIELLEEMEEE